MMGLPDRGGWAAQALIPARCAVKAAGVKESAAKHTSAFECCSNATLRKLACGAAADHV
jgi:hypothetical protein